MQRTFQTLWYNRPGLAEAPFFLFMGVCLLCAFVVGVWPFWLGTVLVSLAWYAGFSVPWMLLAAIYPVAAHAVYNTMLRRNDLLYGVSPRVASSRVGQYMVKLLPQPERYIPAFLHLRQGASSLHR